MKFPFLDFWDRLIVKFGEYKELGYSLYMTWRFTIEIEYNARLSRAANRFHSVGLKRFLALRFATVSFFEEPTSFAFYIPSE